MIVYFIKCIKTHTQKNDFVSFIAAKNAIFSVILIGSINMFAKIKIPIWYGGDMVRSELELWYPTVIVWIDALIQFVYLEIVDL